MNQLCRRVGGVIAQQNSKIHIRNRLINKRFSTWARPIARGQEIEQKPSVETLIHLTRASQHKLQLHVTLVGASSAHVVSKNFLTNCLAHKWRPGHITRPIFARIGGALFTFRPPVTAFYPSLRYLRTVVCVRFFGRNLAGLAPDFSTLCGPIIREATWTHNRWDPMLYRARMTYKMGSKCLNNANK